MTRNLVQSRPGGGADCLDCPPWAIECKRQEKLTVNTWWAQTCAQADSLGRYPALAYRPSRRPWTVVVPMSVMLGDTPGVAEERVALSLDGFVILTEIMQTARAQGRFSA